MNWLLPRSIGLMATLICATAGPARADEALIAVASNFATAMERLEADFERRTGHNLTVTTGSTGRLYAQIRHGAPFDALLAADSERPARLETDGQAVTGSRFVYAVGQLALWTSRPEIDLTEGLTALSGPDFRHLAIANPALAPYGAAAAELIAAQPGAEHITARLVIGESIAQAYLMTATGNADLGFVAVSQLIDDHNAATNRYWPVPESLHAPIQQEAVLLEHGAENIAARDFLTYLRGPDAAVIIAQSGYRLES
jgi:molybdate transport system substrate-binding protein